MYHVSLMCLQELYFTFSKENNLDSVQREFEAIGSLLLASREATKWVSARSIYDNVYYTSLKRAAQLWILLRSIQRTCAECEKVSKMVLKIPEWCFRACWRSQVWSKSNLRCRSIDSCNWSSTSLDYRENSKHSSSSSIVHRYLHQIGEASNEREY